MARIENGKYVPNAKIKVKQITVDGMKQLGMKKAIEKANSGGADNEFVEAAKRFYGNRVTGKAADPHLRGNVPQGSPAVIEETVTVKPGPSKQKKSWA